MRTSLDGDASRLECRGLRQGDLEHAVFDALVAGAKSMGVKAIIGRYRPTAKNLLVRDFYATIGFDLVEENDQQRVFRYEIPQEYENLNTVIEVEN